MIQLTVKCLQSLQLSAVKNIRGKLVQFILPCDTRL
jgi:hypothetical protein